jgi:thioredoxin 2
MILECSACGQQNRVPEAKLTQTGRCGKCKGPLGPVSAPLEVGPSEFDAIARESDAPVLVDFWAEWCGPCRMAAPVVKKVAERFAGRALVLKVNTDEHPELAARFAVQGIPNFVVLKGGRSVFQQPGLVNEATMARWLENAL